MNRSDCPPAWLELDGVEISNSNRLLTYLRRAAIPQMSVTLAAPLLAESGYEDVYFDSYLADFFTPENLQCFCKLVDDEPYFSPAADPAPWYSPAYPESADFYGFFVSKADLDPVPSRRVTDRNRGASLGPMRLKGRVIGVSGSLFAKSIAGMQFGRRWLADRLYALCSSGDCDQSVMRLLPVCTDDDSGFRTLVGVGLVDGPVTAEIGRVPAGVVQQVSFQLVASEPALLRSPVEVIPDRQLPAADVLCGLASMPAGLGDAGLKIVLRAGTDGGHVGPVVITATPTTGTCPITATPETITYTIPVIDPPNELVIDASRHQVVMRDGLTGEPTGGLDVVEFSGLFQWLELCAGQKLCVCVDTTAAAVNAGSRIEVSLIARELA